MTGNGPTEWEQVRAAVERAKPFLDASHDRAGSKWAPSDLIRIGYSMLATGRNPDGAAGFVNDMLDEARNRYAAGFFADPFMEPVRVRS